MPNKFLNASLVLFCLGFFTCTWDLLLFADIGGFTLKIQQLLFGLSFLCAVIGRSSDGLAALLSPMRGGFPLAMLALGTYYLALSPFSYFPLKSFLYAGWLIFNLCVVWGSAQLLEPYLDREKLQKVVWVTLVFHAMVLLIDHAAFQFGYKHGLIGHNQEKILMWGVSRPHAFASEPSYIAFFFSMAILVLHRFLLDIRNWVFVPFSLFSFLAIFATSSRSGLVTLGAGAAMLFCLDTWKNKALAWRQIVLTLTLLGAAFGLLFIFTPQKQRSVIDQSLISSLARGKDGSGNTRMQAHLIAVEIARETNWIGVGMGASHRYWTEKHNIDVSRLSADYGHEMIMSIWGQLLAEGGIPALALFAAAGFFLIRGLFRAWMTSGHPLNLGALVSCALFFSLMAFFLGNVARGDVWVWFAVWGILAKPFPLEKNRLTSES